MKSVFFTAIAALAASAAAAPTKTNDGPISDLLPSGAGSNVPSNMPSSLPSNLPTPAKGGHLIEDAAPKVNEVLTVVGQDLKPVLIKLSPEVAGLLSGLGLPSLGVPVGQIVRKASSVGELLKDLGAPVEHLLTVVSQDGSVLLIKLSAEVAGLLSRIGLPQIGVPVGQVVNTLGQSVKRDGKIVQDVAPKVDEVLTVLGQDLQPLLIKLSPEVAALLSTLGLPMVGIPVGQIVRKTSSVGELVKDLGQPVEELLIVTGKGVGALLIKLSPAVAALLSGLGLPTVGTPVGAVVHIVGSSL